MILVEQHIIKNTNFNFEQCDDLCFKSKNLYNYALYKQYQKLEESGTIYNYNELEKLLRVEERHESYFALPPNTSQQILMILAQNFKSYFQALKSWKKDKRKFKAIPQRPKFKHKTKGRNIIVFTSNQFRLRNGFILFPNKVNMNPLKTNLLETIKLVRIIPKLSYYVIEIVYEKQEQFFQETENKLAIDIGVNNLFACVSNTKVQNFIINGKPLKSINQYYNKKKAKLQSRLETNNKKKTSKRLRKLAFKRNNKIKNYLHKASKKVVTFCKTNQISEIVIGYNEGWKEKLNMGSKTNQSFHSIPFLTGIQMIEYKAKMEGIKVKRINEAYTSVCSAIDLEKLCKHEKYVGKRIERGWFRTQNGLTINSDINGALNIGRKEFSDDFINRRDIGYVDYPKLINLT